MWKRALEKILEMLSWHIFEHTLSHSLEKKILDIVLKQLKSTIESSTQQTFGKIVNDFPEPHQDKVVLYRQPPGYMIVYVSL